MPIRVNAAAVANGELTVEPGGAAVFLIEWDGSHDDYLKFHTLAPGAFGELTLAHYNGTLTTRERIGNI